MLPDVSEKISYDGIFPRSSRHGIGFQTRPHLPHSARLRKSAGLAAGHAPGQVRGVGCGYPGSDEQRAYRGAAWVAVRNRELATPVTGMPIGTLLACWSSG
jgi:hypothetical protein